MQVLPPSLPPFPPSIAPSLQSNNLVFHSVTQYWNVLSKEGGVVGGVARPHIITSNLEHDSVQLCVRKMEAEGQIGQADWELRRERQRQTKGDRERSGRKYMSKSKSVADLLTLCTVQI